jgi:alpha-glucoside transport system substrate-binding protein
MLIRTVNILLAWIVLEVFVVGPGTAQPSKVHTAVLWGGNELDAFKAMTAPFEEETGIEVVVEPVGRDLPTVLVTRFHAGNPPDVAAMPSPGLMRQFVAAKGLIALDESIVADYPQAFVDLGKVDGKLYGIFVAADLKSLIWYNRKEFAARGFEIPATWNELIALSDQIVADGGKPWCLGLESGAASGWPGTDWIEDIMLRTAGPDIYDKWVNHDIEWTDDRVYHAWENFGTIARNKDYIFGGTTGALTINFGDSPQAMFTDPPGCYLHRQASFILSFIKKANPALEPGQDFDVFLFPPIDPKHGNPLLGSGDLISAFNDRPEVRQFMKYLTSAQAQEIWIGRLGKLGVNTKINPSVYPDAITAKAASILRLAKCFRFDASDLMPAAVGSGAFWGGVLDYVSGKSLKRVLENIEKIADEAYRN